MTQTTKTGPVVTGSLAEGERVRPRGTGVKGTVKQVRNAQAIVLLDNGSRVNLPVRELVVI